MQPTDRRSFLRQSLQTTAALAGLSLAGPSAALAIEPFKRPGKPVLRLSLAAYSFRQFFKYGRGEKPTDKPPAKQIELFDFVNYCADQGCEGTELTSYYFPPNPDHDYCVKLRRQAFLRGVAVSGTSVGNTFTLPAGEKRNQEIANVKAWIDRAALLSAPHIRVFAGNAGNLPKDEAKKLCIAALEETCAYAGSRGIFLGIENHGGIVAEPDDLLDIIKSVNSPWIGINLDTANFRTTDPYADLARCAPYAVNVQLKADIHPKGQASQLADIPRLIKLLRDVNYQGYVVLEYESSPDPWERVPKLLEEMRRAMAG